MLLLVAAVLAAGGVFARCDTALAASPSGILTGYGTTTWGQKDGLPSAVIWALAQDRAGYLWLGTNTGLVRFDGVRFAEWSTLSDAPLRELPIRALLAAGDALWVGYGEPGGVSRIADGKVQHYGSAEGLPAGLVATLLEDSAGQSGLARERVSRRSPTTGGRARRAGCLLVRFTVRIRLPTARCWSEQARVFSAGRLTIRSFARSGTSQTSCGMSSSIVRTARGSPIPSTASARSMTQGLRPAL